MVHRDLQCCQHLLATEISLCALKKQWFTLIDSLLYIFHKVFIFCAGEHALKHLCSRKQKQSKHDPTATETFPVQKEPNSAALGQILFTAAWCRILSLILHSLSPVQNWYGYPESEESLVVSPTTLCMLATPNCSSFCRDALFERAFVWDQAVGRKWGKMRMNTYIFQWAELLILHLLLGNFK